MQKNMQSNITQLMQKDMDRKDFIKHVGVGFIALTGAMTAMKAIAQLNTSSSVRSSGQGYGASVYGGAPVANRR